MSSSNTRVAVIVLTMNQRDETLDCIASLKAIDQPEFEILVWDNNSEDDTVDAIRKAYPGVMVHPHTENLGVASGRNQAARMAIETWNPSHLLFLDNDMVVEADFVKALLAPFQREVKVGQTQAKLLLMNDRSRINDGGGIHINFLLGKTQHVGFGEIDRGQFDQEKPCISCGGAMMVRRDLFEKLNGFDPIFNPYGPEDIDFSLRLQKAGYIALYIPKAVAYHAVNHTFGKGFTSTYARHKTRKWFLLMNRHASLWQRMFFMGLTAPWLFVKVAARESAKGNFSVLRGLAKGVLDLGKSKTSKQAADR